MAASSAALVAVQFSLAVSSASGFGDARLNVVIERGKELGGRGFLAHEGSMVIPGAQGYNPGLLGRQLGRRLTNVIIYVTCPGFSHLEWLMVIDWISNCVSLTVWVIILRANTSRWSRVVSAGTISLTDLVVVLGIKR